MKVENYHYYELWLDGRYMETFIKFEYAYTYAKAYRKRTAGKWQIVRVDVKEKRKVLNK